MLCYVHIVYEHEYLPLFLFFTHSLGQFLTTLDLHVQIGCFISLVRYLLRSGASRGAQSFSLLDHRYSCSLSFLLFLDSPYIIISCHFIFVFIYYHVWILICDIAVIVIHLVNSYSLF